MVEEAAAFVCVHKYGRLQLVVPLFPSSTVSVGGSAFTILPLLDSTYQVSSAVVLKENFTMSSFGVLTCAESDLC